MTIIRPGNIVGSDRYVAVLSTGKPAPAVPPKERCPDCGMAHLRSGYCQGRDPLYSPLLKAGALPAPQAKLPKP